MIGGEQLAAVDGIRTGATDLASSHIRDLPLCTDAADTDHAGRSRPGKGISDTADGCPVVATAAAVVLLAPSATAPALLDVAPLPRDTAPAAVALAPEPAARELPPLAVVLAPSAISEALRAWAFAPVAVASTPVAEESASVELVWKYLMPPPLLRVLIAVVLPAILVVLVVTC